jgi:DNA-binding NarL/FixJ family response regulator
MIIDVRIVDDHTILAEGLCRLIRSTEIAQVSAIYPNLDSCRKGLSVSLPNVLLLDVELPDGNGLDFCAEIKELYPALKILILTSYTEFSIVKRALENGALGYIEKSANSKELIDGIKTINIGKPFLSKEMEDLIKKNGHKRIIRISPREKQVLTALANGLSTSEIAKDLYLSIDTVNGYRKDLLLKFNVQNSTGLIKIALDQKLL